MNNMPLQYRIVSVVFFAVAVLYTAVAFFAPQPFDLAALLWKLGTSSAFVAFALSPHILFGRRAPPGQPDAPVPSFEVFTPASRAFVWLAVGLWLGALSIALSRTLL